MFTLFQVPYAKQELSAAVGARLHRQLALFDNDKQFEFLITEAALRWRPGAPKVLLAQLDRIASISTLENVSIGLIPHDADPTTTISHSFVIYEGDEEDTKVSIETVHASMLIRTPEDIELYRGRWNLLRQMAIFGDQARDFLTMLATDVRSSVNE